MATAIVVSFVKSNGGILRDANNYRAIAISTEISKMFEYVLLQRMTPF